MKVRLVTSLREFDALALIWEEVAQESGQNIWDMAASLCTIAGCYLCKSNTGMRILIDSSSDNYLNIGDTAMLRVVFALLGALCHHAAIFALSQGIPAVGLANSDYYVDKCQGLAQQFGTGREVILLKDAQLPVELRAAIERGWRSAEQGRPQLLEAAARQVELSRAAYHRVYEVVESRSATARIPCSNPCDALRRRGSDDE